MLNKKVSRPRLSCFPRTARKRGATQWTIGKLMTIVLLVIVLALVVYGVSTKGLNPLIERAGGMFDSVQLMFGFGEGASDKGDCGKPYLQYVEMVGEGTVIRCKGSCSIKFEEGLSFGNEFNWTGGSLFVQSGTHQDEIFDIIDDLPSAIKEREANQILREEYESYTSSFDDDSFMNPAVMPIYFLVKGNGGRKYFKWDNGVWFEEKYNNWEGASWIEDEGLKKIYSESDDWFSDDEVFYSIGVPESGMKFISRVGQEGFVPVEDIKAGEDYYELLDIFEGDSGQIDSEDDFKIFQEWFLSEKQKMKESKNASDSRFIQLEELLPLESSGEFMGEPYSLFVVRDLYGEVVFYLGTSGEKYGLKGEDLDLVKGSEDNRWDISETYSTLFRAQEEFEEYIKIHKIRKFLEGLRC